MERRWRSFYPRRQQKMRAAKVFLSRSRAGRVSLIVSAPFPILQIPGQAAGWVKGLFSVGERTQSKAEATLSQPEAIVCETEATACEAEATDCEAESTDCEADTIDCEVEPTASVVEATVCGVEANGCEVEATDCKAEATGCGPQTPFSETQTTGSDVQKTPSPPKSGLFRQKSGPLHPTTTGRVGAQIGFHHEGHEEHEAKLGAKVMAHVHQERRLRALGALRRSKWSPHPQSTHA